MPREMPEYASNFETNVRKYLIAIDELEDLRFHIEKGYLHNLSIYRLEHYYELVYLRIFLEWEGFISECCFRSMCGYSFHGQKYSPVSCFAKTPKIAEQLLLNGTTYLLWHNPDQICKRVKRFVVNSNIENVIMSHKTKLEQYSVIRHRIAHNQIDAIQKFDATTIMLTGKSYKSASAGKYLRDFLHKRQFQSDGYPKLLMIL
jgi:hypothetical protein